MVSFGQIWSFSTLSSPYNLNDVYFINDSVGFAVGDNGVILSSNDGGDNWVIVSSGTTNNLVDILFYNDTVGYICSKDDGNPNNGGNGVGGTLLKTNDGGNTWNIFYIENDDVDYNKIGLILAPNTPYEQIYILGEYIQSGRTDAMLIEITASPLPSSSLSTLTNSLYVNDVYMPYYNTFIAVGYPNVGSSYGSFRRVGGVDMNMTTPYSINFNSIDFIDGTNRCIMVGNAFAFSGSGGVIYELDNMYDQNNYQFNLNSFTSTHDFNSVDMIGNHGWVVGDGGVIANTTDGGSTWSAYSNSNFQDLNSVFLLDSCNGWIVGENGIFSKINCVLGCTDSTAINYDPNALIDDGSCIIPFSNLPDSISACDSVQICVDSIAGGSYSWSTSNISPSFSGAIGDAYQGGIVFHYDSINGNGLIAANTNQGAAEWGCQGTYISGADGTAIGTGQQNTLDIIAGCSTAGIAARLSDSYSITQDGITYNDWYLPSKDELQLIRTNLWLPYGVANPIGLNGLNYYWSSTEDWGSSAICQQMYSSSQPHASKSISYYYAHSIRSFNYQPHINTDTTNCVWVSNSGWNYITVSDNSGNTATDSICLLYTSPSPRD